MVLADQRTMYGTRFEDAGEIAAFWESFAADRGFPLNPERREPVTSKTRLEAYVSEGRWVASCPECNGGIACWPEHDRGCCLDCGSLYKIRFPAKRERERAERLLLERPIRLRHWHPHEGESVGELAAQNKLLEVA